jgi:hypothetical protein
MSKVARHVKPYHYESGIVSVMTIDESLKTKLLVAVQFISIMAAIYGVYADASKNLEAAKTARDKQITELNLSIALHREALAELKRENDHFRLWIKSSSDNSERNHDRLEDRLGRIESTLMQRK